MRIQKNVPMPNPKPRGHNGTNKARYPWREMEVGDSFLFPGGRHCHAAALQASKYTGKVFKCCKMDDGYRCWRTK